MGHEIDLKPSPADINSLLRQRETQQNRRTEAASRELTRALVYAQEHPALFATKSLREKLTDSAVYTSLYGEPGKQAREGWITVNTDIDHSSIDLQARIAKVVQQAGDTDPSSTARYAWILQTRFRTPDEGKSGEYICLEPKDIMTLCGEWCEARDGTPTVTPKRSGHSSITLASEFGLAGGTIDLLGPDPDHLLLAELEAVEQSLVQPVVYGHTNIVVMC